MKRFGLIDSQDYLIFNEQDLIIIDKIQNMPENSSYYSEYVLVLICTEGKIQIEYDERTVRIHKGELFLGVPGSVLSDYMISPNFDCKLLAIKPSEAMATRELHTQILSSMLYIKANPVVQLSETDYETVFIYYNLICSRLQQSKHRYINGEVRSLVNAFLLKIVGAIDCGKDSDVEAHAIRGEQIAEKFVWMVNEDCGQNRQVEYYADRLHITPKYLSTLVKASLNRKPSEVIKVVAIKEIERRLRYTDDSIKQISVSLNFPNTSFFGKYFKQHTGMTPNTYRTKYHK